MPEPYFDVGDEVEVLQNHSGWFWSGIVAGTRGTVREANIRDGDAEYHIDFTIGGDTWGQYYEHRLGIVKRAKPLEKKLSGFARFIKKIDNEAKT
jgi:hypothetical protein